MPDAVLDLIPPADLQQFVRGLQTERDRNQFTLSRYLPSTTVNDTEFRFTRGSLLDVDVAMFRSFDAESPIAKRQGGTRVTGQLPPISQKIRLGEEERLRLEVSRTGSTATLVEAIYADASLVARGLLARLEQARGQALYAGEVTISENGLTATADFNRSPSHDVAPAVLWSDAANSDPIADLVAWSQVYITTNGVAPGEILMSQTVLQNILRNARVRVLAGSQAGQPGVVARAQLNDVFSAYDLPGITTYDTQVRVNGVSTRVIPANRVILLPPPGEPLGAVLTGITAEALELQGNGFITTQDAAGLTIVQYKTPDPVATWTKASALAMPVLANPDLTLVATVQ